LCECESELLCNYVMHVHHMLHFRLQKETMTLNMDPQGGEDSFAVWCWKVILHPFSCSKAWRRNWMVCLSSDHSVRMCCSCMFTWNVTCLEVINFLQRVQCLVQVMYFISIINFRTWSNRQNICLMSTCWK